VPAIDGNGSQLGPGERAIAAHAPGIEGANCGVLSLLFWGGRRPDVSALVGLGANADPDLPGFTISHLPEDGQGVVELLVHGLTFDCQGIAPAAAAPSPAPGSMLGLSELPIGAEAISLVGGAHLAGAGGLPPIVRAQIGLALRLATLPELCAVHWAPANSWMAPAYFAKIARDWLGGGAFPALGLVTFSFDGTGTLCSKGLAYLAGRELAIVPGTAETQADMVRLAARVVHELVHNIAVGTAPCPLAGPGSERLTLAVDSSSNQFILRPTG
jgi:hypothetical protein